MAAEQFVNSGYTTLNGAITAIVTSITVNSVPATVSALASGQIRAAFGDYTNELVIIQLPISGTTFNVTRGAEGTTVAAHGDLCPIIFQLTAGQCNQFAQVQNQLGGTGQAPIVTGITETSGPTQLPIGPIANSQLLQRIGNEIAGVSASNLNASAIATLQQLLFAVLTKNQVPFAQQLVYGPTTPFLKNLIALLTPKQTLNNFVGPILPSSSYASSSSGLIFPNFYAGGGGNNAPHDFGLGVAASLSADSTWELRFMLPPVIPPGSPKLRMLALANATTGIAKYTVSDAVISSGSSPSAATLVAENQQTVTWTQADVYNLSLSPLSSGMVANGVLVVALKFQTSGWTLAQVSTWIPSLIWS